jgi:hypothetical protein
MSKKSLVVLLVVGALVLSAVTFVFAQEDTTAPVDTPNYGRVLRFIDGRINAFDMAAPVAIYYTHETVTTPIGTRMLVPNGIELFAIQPVTNNGVRVLDVNEAEIEQLVTGRLDSIEAGGFSLDYSGGQFHVTAPPDAEGKVYNFVWRDTAIALG